MVLVFQPVPSNIYVIDTYLTRYFTILVKFVHIFSPRTPILCCLISIKNTMVSAIRNIYLAVNLQTCNGAVCNRRRCFGMDCQRGTRRVVVEYIRRGVERRHVVRGDAHAALEHGSVATIRQRRCR